MPLAWADVLDRLKALDEITLVEVLNLTAEDIVNRCTDLIEEDLERLTEALDDTDCGREE